MEFQKESMSKGVEEDNWSMSMGVHEWTAHEIVTETTDRDKGTFCMFDYCRQFPFIIVISLI